MGIKGTMNEIIMRVLIVLLIDDTGQYSCSFRFLNRYLKGVLKNVKLK